MISSLLITNALILDVKTGAEKRADIFVERGIIREIGLSLQKQARSVLDASKYVVTPGLVDAHAHIYYDSKLLGVDPQVYHLPRGVTYVVDQGSAGADNYEDFRRRVLFRTDMRCKSYLNCSRVGMPLTSLTGDGELADPANLDRDAFVNCYTKYADELLGLKIRLTPNICPRNPLAALEKALDIAASLSIPVVFHPNHAEMSTEDILGRLRPGDVYTHTYNNSKAGILNSNGQVKECVLKARKRGIVFDTGHGANSMSFPVLHQAVSCGFLPDTISTDLHNANVNGPVFDMPATISKFLCVGVPLVEAIRMTLVNPARLFRLSDKATTIAEGAIADIAAFELREGRYDYYDAEKNKIEGKFKLVPQFTVLGEKLFTAP